MQSKISFCVIFLFDKLDPNNYDFKVV
jgi:hypothetical protein